MEDNDLIKPDGSVKGYSYFGGKLKVEGEEDRDAVLATGAIREFNGGGLVQYLNNGGKVSEMPPKKGFEGWETYDTSGMKGVVVREPSADKTGLKKFTLPNGSVQYESIPSLSQQVRSR